MQAAAAQAWNKAPRAAEAEAEAEAVVGRGIRRAGAEQTWGDWNYEMVLD